jgi:hypothetical protein
MGIQERRTQSWLEYKDRLDWFKISAEMEKFAAEKGGVHHSEEEQARKCVFTGLERWLAEDLANCRVIEVESPFEDEYKRGFIDVLLQVLDAPEDAVFAPFAGAFKGVDWKTSRNTLSSDWRDRHLYSWQGPTYCHGIGKKYQLTPRLFEYRGISRSLETKPVLLQIDNPAPSVEVQYGGLRVMRDALIAAELPVWPKNMPSACGAYGRDCEYLEDCREHTEPFVQIERKPFSYSGASTFMLCPEKYRRNLVAGSADSEETIFGNLVHVGLAEAYRQAKEWVL